jgi:CBS domain-containing membrane protein
MKANKESPPRKPISKIIWSWLGAFLGIYLVSTLNRLIQIDFMDSLFLVGSFGASAVLIYGAPQAELSQPRNLIGGHVISAIVGVTLYNYLPIDLAIVSALSVSIAIAFMHLTRTLHPPGGATALIAVIGSSKVHDLGYLYVLSPILLGAFLMLIVALIVNNLSNDPKRHYPTYWL